MTYINNVKCKYIPSFEIRVHWTCFIITFTQYGQNYIYIKMGKVRCLWEQFFSPTRAHYHLHISLKLPTELYFIYRDVYFICLFETSFIVLVQHAFGLAILLPLPLNYRFIGFLFHFTFSLILTTLHRNLIYTVVPDIAPSVKTPSSCSANYDNERDTLKSKQGRISPAAQWSCNFEPITRWWLRPMSVKWNLPCLPHMIFIILWHSENWPADSKVI